jgi:4-hydroxybenzoate polyprenyltransferase
MNFATITAKLDAYERLIRLDKPIGFMLLMWPTLWALWIASRGQPDPMMTWIFILGSVLTRSAGVVVNDLADMRYDGAVKRTRERPLVTGAVSRAEAIVFGLLLLAASFLLVLQLNTLTIKLSFVAVALAATYPFFKRFFVLPQAYLGIAFGFGMPMAFAACLNQLPPIVWQMLAANVFWAIAYDTEYAMVDRDDDLGLGMRTSAITFGRFDVLAVMVCYAAMLAILAAVRDAASLRRVLLSRTGRGGGLHGLSLRAHPRAQARGLLPRLPLQQLGRRRDIRRHRPRTLHAQPIGLRCNTATSAIFLRNWKNWASSSVCAPRCRRAWR